ncbi:LrgB family protein [Nitrincola tapanii]|jgi:predicted murein hydrolase (TIGR00659 family)|uniref:LrgB family protein n=1 Tax=Nitrincola tapanii TaxID=1708751 RepID=A0A5A9W2X8_9GAMM|nr:LrgB family protein [Nitrincola tapanii]KAA0873911.1 LrgB family protein [Nitrincola tapanii]
MEINNFWVYFAARPLFWILVTLTVFQLALWLNKKARGHSLAHPVMISLTLIILLLLLTETDYDTYFEGAQFIHFLLGPATVALAIPLYDHFARIRRMLLPILVSCLVGSVTAVISAVGIAWLLGSSTPMLLSLAPKSVTSPIAIGIAEQIGGYPSLAAGLVLITGVIGCLLAPSVFRILKIQDDSVKGFALGLAAHGFGTAYALQMSMLAGAFAGLAMGLTGVFSSFLVPLVVRLAGLG